MGLLETLLASVPGIAETGYNLWTNKRDFDYQKALQQQIFEREDTAVQRRTEDLRAAGLNPALASGSAASAGSVVSRSNTNDVDFGAALDTVSALAQIRQQRQLTENAKEENKILKSENKIKEIQMKINMANALQELGIPYKSKIFMNKAGRPDINLDINHDDIGKIFNPKMQEIFDFNYNNMKNNAEFLQKDLNWYIVDKVYGYLAPFIPQLKFNMNQSQSTNTNTNNNRNYSNSTNHNYNYNYNK